MQQLVGWFGFHVSEIRYRLWGLFFIVVLCLGAYSVYCLQTNVATILHVYLFLTVLIAGSIGALVHVVHMRYGKIVSVAAGVLLVAAGLYLANYRSAQVDTYNQAMVALDEGRLPEAVKLFDESVVAYEKEAQRSRLFRLVYPEGRRDLKARALFHKGNALLRLRKGKETVKAYRQSLMANPGNHYSGMTVEEAAQLYNDALHCQSNLEKLHQAGQAGGQPRGRGRGRGQRPGPKREGQPSNGSGSQKRESL